MNILSIRVKNYRNLSEQTIHPGKGINVIFGNNAQGKTNFLEAIWISTGGRSFRGTKDVNLIKFKEKSAKATVNFFAKERDQQIETIISDGKRRIFLNSIAKIPISSVVGEFTSVVFSPTHLSLIKDGPLARRNFLDTAICQTKPTYAKILLQYRKVLNQRNSLLKSIQSDNTLTKTLEVWDEKLADYGQKIRTERTKYVLSMQELLSNSYFDLTNGKEKLELLYRRRNPEKPQEPSLIKRELIQELQQNRAEDIARRFTSKGPHRDDLEIRMNNKLIRLFGSQGQQRSAVLAMKIAEAQILESTTKEKPVILLDDVMSELDTSHQNYILDFIKDGQIFITCCEPTKLSESANAKIFKAEKGVLLEAKN